MPIYDTDDPQQAFKRLRATGRATLPRDPVQARLAAQGMVRTATGGSFADDVMSAAQSLSRGPSLARLQAMKNSRRGSVDRRNLADGTEAQIQDIENMRRTGAIGDPAGGRTLSDVTLAWPKRRDPLREFKEQSWFWLDNNDWNESVKKLREWSRLVYLTHHLVPSLIDIYARFPLLDIEFKHKDQKLACTPQETPIWMGDYSFKPISEVEEGDEVIGWERLPSGKARLRRTKVLHTFKYEQKQVLKVTMQSGRTLRCTPEHRWANYLYSPGRQEPVESSHYVDRERRRMQAARMFEEGIPQNVIAESVGVSKAAVSLWHKTWREGGVDELRTSLIRDRSGTERRYAEWTNAVPSARFRHVIDPTPELTDEKERISAAWLGGVYDGEGTGKTIAQSLKHNPDVRDRIIESLERLGLRAYEYPNERVIGFQRPRSAYTTHNSRQELTNFLNWTNPVRRTRKAIDNQLLSGSFGESDIVESVEPDGVETVYALTTETGNYVAWGFASSNSWYQSVFMDELNYQEFLFDMNREYWTVGEAFPLGSWNDAIGCWDDDELLNPDDVIVARNKALRRFEYHIKIPDSIRKLVDTKEPREEYETLLRDFPYVMKWVQQDKELPVSDILLKQLKFKASPWMEHGVPILMRAFQTMMYEQSLTAAQQGVADRLYSPLILAKIGLEDLGDGEGPLIPDAEEVAAVRDDLSIALMSDFRVMAYHHGLDIQSVFGREVMPRLGDDFDRVDKALMQIFGIGAELLSGGKSNVPYAAGSLNRELMTQMLQTSQVGVRNFLRSRMEVVAEAQGHYEYDRKGDMRVPIMQQSLMVDPETGEEYIEERPKLAIPEVSFKTMNLRDETVERQFYLSMKQAGIPVSDATLMTNVPMEFDEEIEKVTEEKLEKTVAQLEYKRQLFLKIYTSMQKGPQFALPVPADFAAEFDQWLAGMAQVAAPGATPDITQPAPTPDIAPAGPGFAPAAPGGGGGGEEPAPEGKSRPEESDDQRKNAPKKSGLGSRVASFFGIDRPDFETQEAEPASIIDDPFTETETAKVSRYSEFAEENMKIGEPMKVHSRMKLPAGMQVETVEGSVRFEPTSDIFSKIAGLDERLGESDGDGESSEDDEGADDRGEGVDSPGEVPGG